MTSVSEARTRNSEKPFEAPAFSPRPPLSPEDLDIPRSIVEDLLLRSSYTKGNGSLRKLSKSLKLSFPLLHAVFQELRQQQLFEVTGMDGNDYFFALSGIGRERAAKSFLNCQYVGPAPVSMASYSKAVSLQAARPVINRALLRAAFSDMVVSEHFIDQLGPALHSQKSIFLYGPTGNGKTSIVGRLARLYLDAVAIPYAIEVDGQVIVVYDPAVHEAVGENPRGLDPRWVLCRRPCLIVGGELQAQMLELQLEPTTRIYAAPVQMRANNGILVIDDLGRQVVSPRQLLNRWIVPLDCRVDYLTLQYGLKFQIPFEMTVVFSTNLDPAGLADEAFLRRIPNKIRVDDVGERAFFMIFERVVHERRLSASPEAAPQLRDLCLELGGKLRACQPADIVDLIVSISTFDGFDPEISPDNLERAARIYFGKPGES